jgi:hypothetical protein
VTRPSDTAIHADADDRDDFQALQQLVAARHHVLLGRDDPIAMLQTVNELLVQRTATALEQAQTVALTKFGHELALSLEAWKREAKELSERTLTAALQTSQQQIATATQDLLNTLAVERSRTKKAAKRAATFNWLLLLAVVGLLGRLWLH